MSEHKRRVFSCLRLLLLAAGIVICLQENLVYACPFMQDDEQASVFDKLKTKVDVDFNETPLREAMEEIGRQINVEIFIDEPSVVSSLPPQFSVEGELTPSDFPTITFQHEGLSARLALDLILIQKKLSWTVRNGHIVVTTREALEEDSRYMEVRIWNVTDRTKWETPDGLCGGALEDVVRRMIRPDDWDRWGGEGDIQELFANRREVLIIRQTPRIQEEIGDFLAELERLDVPADVRPDPSYVAEDAEIMEQLRRLNPQESDAPTISEALEEASQSNPFLDRPAFMGDGSVTLDEGESLVERITSYEQIYPDYEQTPVDGTIVFIPTSDDLRAFRRFSGFSEKSWLVRIYDVSPLIQAGIRPETIEYQVMHTINHRELSKDIVWGHGQPSCEFDPCILEQEHGSFLIVRQPWRIHRLIEEHLASHHSLINEQPDQFHAEWESISRTHQIEWRVVGSQLPRIFYSSREIPVLTIPKDAAQGVSLVDIEAAIEGTNRLGFEMTSQFASDLPNENIVLSPLGLRRQFAVPYSVSSGESSEAIQELLDYSCEPFWIGRIYAKLLRDIEEPCDRSYSLSRYSRAQQAGRGRPVDSPIPSPGRTSIEIERHLGATLGESLTEVAAYRLGAELLWADESKSDYPKAVLRGFSHFNAYWAMPFNPVNTIEDAVFHSWDGESESNIPLMRRRDVLPQYVKLDSGTQAVRLDCQHTEYSIILMLPPEGRAAFDEFEASLTPDSFQNMLDIMKPELVDLYLPRFRAESEIDLTAFLPELTLEQDDPTLSLNIDPFHTSVQFMEDSACIVNWDNLYPWMDPSPVDASLVPIPMRIDRPFFLVVLHGPTGCITHFGRIVEPTPCEREE